MSAKILRPEGEIFEIAASEFRKYAALLTGESPEAVSEDDGASDLFILGNDAENPFAGTAYLAGRLETAGVRCGSDDFAVRFSEKDGSIKIKKCEPIFITTYINTANEFVIKPLNQDFVDYLNDVPRTNWAKYIERRIKINKEATKDLIEWQ